MIDASDDRIRRLRTLESQIEALPLSRERDRLLRDVRGRVVELQSGPDERAIWRAGDGDQNPSRALAGDILRPRSA